MSAIGKMEFSMTAAKSESTNHWPERDCARACWGQHELPPYKELLADTSGWLDPGPLEKWLDLGCGAGHLSRVLWQLGEGRVAEIVGVDCAAVNARAYEKLRGQLRLTPRDRRLRFVVADFSNGLSSWEDNHFDGVVSGLAIQYAESFDARTGEWTTAGYDRLLAEVRRVLRPGGRFVFSVNVPEPSWGRVAWRSLLGVFRSRRPLRYLKNAVRMWRYG